ncbi:hypothetical protein B0H14DRAFT_3448941 [Mycena olivaceomarginata]|nr:hypothetical protein B0H14DRAFT_3448941 [Mycena olivaceomarginata]
MSTAAQLKLLQSSFQRAFLTAPDIPCPSKDVATVCAVGSGAGNFTYILVQGAGHFVDPTVKDQPALAKKVVHHWVANEPLF